MTENELSAVGVDICYKIHISLGPGLLESVYEELLHMNLISEIFLIQGNKAS